MILTIIPIRRAACPLVDDKVTYELALPALRQSLGKAQAKCDIDDYFVYLGYIVDSASFLTQKGRGRLEDKLKGYALFPNTFQLNYKEDLGDYEQTAKFRISLFQQNYVLNALSGLGVAEKKGGCKQNSGVNNVFYLYLIYFDIRDILSFKEVICLYYAAILLQHTHTNE